MQKKTPTKLANNSKSNVNKYVTKKMISGSKKTLSSNTRKVVRKPSVVLSKTPEKVVKSKESVVTKLTSKSKSIPIVKAKVDLKRKPNYQKTKIVTKLVTKNISKNIPKHIPSKLNVTTVKLKIDGRRASFSRKTSETDIFVELNLDGVGKNKINTGIAFLDHMLSLFSRHGCFDLQLRAKGDLDVDIHHTNEDVAISLGKTFIKSLDKKEGIQRYGTFYLPMDDALVRVVLDISDRPSLYIDGLPKSDKTYKQYSYNDCFHFLKSFSNAAGINMHVSVLKGHDRHHILEAIFKALARALDIATSVDARNMTVPSTKGIL